MLDKELNRMSAYKIETIVSEDGTLTLKGLLFHAGDAVEVIILARSPSTAEKAMEQPETNLYPLRGKVFFST
jgi:hypothetical protein